MRLVVFTNFLFTLFSYYFLSRSLTCTAVNKEVSLWIAGHNFEMNPLMRVDIVIIAHQLDHIRASWTTLRHCGEIDGSFR